MRKRVFEPVGVGVALGALIAAFLGQRHNAVRLIFALILLAPFTLGAPEALRRAAGRLTSRREVDFNIATAIVVSSPLRPFRSSLFCTFAGAESRTDSALLSRL